MVLLRLFLVTGVLLVTILDTDTIIIVVTFVVVVGIVGGPAEQFITVRICYTFLAFSGSGGIVTNKAIVVAVIGTVCIDITVAGSQRLAKAIVA
tara:strand:+ start:1013 stop:1294 length:282 start_codon:yes stop_codon:yes gene_type:complete